MGRAIKTESEVLVNEFNGEEAKVGEYKKIKVRNHWNYKSLVVLVVDKDEYTVEADDLIRAIANAQHAHRF